MNVLVRSSILIIKFLSGVEETVGVIKTLLTHLQTKTSLNLRKHRSENRFKLCLRPKKNIFSYEIPLPIISYVSF